MMQYKHQWYSGVFAGGHQGSVSEETTGRTVALTYDPKDAPAIAAVPQLIEAAQKVLEVNNYYGGDDYRKIPPLSHEFKLALNLLVAALQKAKGE